MAPPVVLVAQTEDEKDKMIAKLTADHLEDERKMQAQEEEKKKMEAKLAAQEKEIPATPGPVVKAIIGAMDEDHMEKAKKAIKAAIAQEEDETKKANLEKDLKAMEEIFETGNGVNTNAQTTETTEKEKEQTAVIAALSAKVGKPIVNEILIAKTKAGATEDQIKEENKRLTALTLPELEKEYKSQEVFIKQALSAGEIVEDEAALTAKFEQEFDFNGVNGLTAKTTNIDEILEASSQ